jgi:EAL domain-containing protein (putative c-di-GMP-specific phosphodiesterase class I)
VFTSGAVWTQLPPVPSPPPSDRDPDLDLDAALADGGIRSVFQPLVDLESREVLGYEALSRGPASSAMEHPEALFTAALHADVGSSLTLFVNVEPDTEALPVPDRHLPLVAAAEDRLRIVLEVTEQAVVEHPAELLRTVDWARDRSWGIALDDIGANPGSLAMMPFLEPDVIKLDLRLVQQRPSAEIGLIVSAVLAQAERTGATIVAEGIETEEHLEAAMAMGASVGQGWLFGHPGALPLDGVVRPSQTIPLLRAVAPRAEMTPFSVVRSARPLRRGTKNLLDGIATHLEEQAVAWHDGPVILSTFQPGEAVPEATLSRYEALAGRGSFVVALGVGLSLMPALGGRPPPGQRVVGRRRRSALRGRAGGARPGRRRRRRNATLRLRGHPRPRPGHRRRSSAAPSGRSVASMRRSRREEIRAAATPNAAIHARATMLNTA